MATILIVDDHVTNREFLVTLLGYHGHRTVEATDGAEGLDRARAEHPDLVITDILMPTMDGFEFVRRLRAEPAFGAKPVVFYTAHYLEREARALMQSSGVCLIINKPAEPEAVLRIVHAALGGRGHLPTPEAARVDFDREHLRVITDKLSEKVDELQSANARLAAMIDFSRDLALERDPMQILQALCRAAREIVGARLAVVGIPDGRGRIRHFLTSGADAETAAHLRAQLNGEPALAALSLESRTTRIAKADLGATEPAGQSTIASALLGAAIVSLSGSYGWLALIDKLGAADFTEEDEQLTAMLAGHAGRVYENGRLFVELSARTASLEQEVLEHRQAREQLREQAARLSTLHAIDRAILSQQTLTQIAHAALTSIEVLIRCDLMAVVLFEAESGSARVIARRDKSGIDSPMGALSMDAFSSRDMFLAQPHMYVADIALKEPRSAIIEYLFEIGMRSAVTEALLANGALQGVLILAAAQPQAFTMAHRDILSEIANQLAVAMQTARLREQLQGYIRGLEQEVAERERAQEALQASEARYRDLIENASDIIYTHDLNGDFLSLNAAGEHLIGYFREEVRGLNIAHVIAADHLETARAAMAQQLRGEAPQLHEVELVTKAGHQLPVELSTRLIYEGSTAVGVQGIARDVTARKQAEEALAFKTAVLETQQETSPDGILVVGEHGSLISFNERFRAMWDIPPAIMALRDDEQALQSVLDKVVDPEGFLARVRFLAANREQTSHEEIHLCDGRVLDRYSAPMFGTDGKYYGRVWYVRDVTDRVRAQAAISELNAELEQRVRERTAQLEAANQELQAFSYSVSHDLRAPLRHIEGFSQALREEHGAQLDAEARDYLDRIQLAVRRMGQLIRDLLSLSQVTLRDMAPEVVQLGTLALEIGSALESEALQRQVEFVVAPDLAARGDARLLRIALENLLGNAWKYTSRQPTARIEFGATEHGDGVAYFVRDNGTGFDMEHAKKLFQPFERLHRSEQFEGTGIGLAIVQRIIHRHGGHIWAESAPGQGATFYFTLDGSATSSALRAG